MSVHQLLKHRRVLVWERSETNLVDTSVKKSTKVRFQKHVCFFDACLAGNFGEIVDLLRNGVDVDCKNYEGLSALHKLALNNELGTIKFLIDHGCNVNAQDSEGWTPLHVASDCGHLELVKFLMVKDADAAILNNFGDLAIDMSDTAEIKAYLEEQMVRKGIDVQRVRNKEREDLLKMAKKYLEAGMPIYKIDEASGATPLHIAASKGYSEVLKTLLKCNVDVDARDNDGWTALHAAVFWKQFKSVETLAGNFANIHLLTNKNESIFDLADKDMLRALRKIESKNRKEIKQRLDELMSELHTS